MRRKGFDAAAFAERFNATVPRGVTSRFLKDQTPPQARWQDTVAIYNSKDLEYDPENPGDKVLVGAIGDKLIGISDDSHMLEVARSRAGKSVGLISNLLFYRGSALINDVKGELAAITAERRDAIGQTVHILDPFGIVPDRIARFRSRFNPLAALRPDSPTVIEDAELITEALVIAGEAKDPHWDECSRITISGLILHVISDPAYEGRRTLVTVRDLLMAALTIDEDVETGEDEGPAYILEEQMLANAKRLADSPATAVLAAAIEGTTQDFYEKSAKERDSVLSTARRHTKFLDYASMRSILSGHDFDLSDLKTDATGVTIYLCLPANRLDMCSRWLRIFVSQLLDAMEQTDVKTAAPVLVCLDEFPVLGYMKQFESAIGQIAGFGVKLWVFVQNWSQGVRHYKEGWDTFAANCAVMRAYGVNDPVTAEQIARRLGKTPVPVIRTGETDDKQRQAGLTGRSVDMQLHELMTAEEITRHFSRDNPDKKQLVLWAGRHPMMVQRVDYYDEASPFYHHFKGKYGPRL